MKSIWRVLRTNVHSARVALSLSSGCSTTLRQLYICSLRWLRPTDEETLRENSTSTFAHHRTFVTSSDCDFHFKSSATLQHLSCCIDDWADRHGFDIDLSFESGVLSIDCGLKGVFVINKQGPNRQLWLASPLSGPLRYELCSGCWTNTRDGHNLYVRLKTELETMFGADLSFDTFPDQENS